MKALSKLKAEEGIWMTDVPEPEVGHNDLLIKIRKTAICGTDVHIYNWDDWSQKTIPVPMVVGHEYVGEVVGIGQEVKGFKIGDRVSGEGHITCGHCRNCRGGLPRRSHSPVSQLPRRSHSPVSQHHRRGRQPSRLLRGIPGHPGVQCV
ncbi:putative zinc-binding dehydrogenase [Salmonella enterica subsp. enterica serovar Hvittingfoss str. A4-620]|nr:putative zinc-binding dehydrogenase [Salmonella enterica subsp. enterica serovar Hvittingfoss str. A4-620]